MSTIGDRIRERRAALDMSQEDLARACGISGFTVSKLERGVMKNPGARLLDGVAVALGCTSSDLLHDVAEVA